MLSTVQYGSSQETNFKTDVNVYKLANYSIQWKEKGNISFQDLIFWKKKNFS